MKEKTKSILLYTTIPIVSIIMICGGAALIYWSRVISKNNNETSKILKVLIDQTPKDIFNLKDFNFMLELRGLPIPISSIEQLEFLIDKDGSEINSICIYRTKFLKYIEDYFKIHDIETPEVKNFLDLIKEKDKIINFDKILNYKNLPDPAIFQLAPLIIGICLIVIGSILLVLCMISKLCKCREETERQDEERAVNATMLSHSPKQNKSNRPLST